VTLKFPVAAAVMPSQDLFTPSGTTIKNADATARANALKTIQFQALRLLMPFLDGRENPDHKAIRLLAVKIERFV